MVPFLDVLKNSKEVSKIYPSAMFNEQHVHGFASILCNEGWVHNDYMETEYEGVVAPAAVFYFGFDGVLFFKKDIFHTMKHTCQHLTNHI